MTAGLITGIGRLFAPTADRSVTATNDAAIAWSGGRITWVGRETDLPGDLAAEPTLDVEGRAIVPGFVDAHTHLVYAGDRLDEFSRRLRGESYEQIAASGGGIHSTVAAVRTATVEDLATQASERLGRMARSGTTTVEIKTGYGLDLAGERRMLDVIDRLRRGSAVDIVTTLLAAHAVPPGIDRADYVDTVVNDIVPSLGERAEFCDVFCDRGAFSPSEAARVLEAGAALGLGVRIHAEQLGHTGAAALAARLGAASADHLDHADPEDLEALRRAGTVAVLLPGVSLSMRTPFPDGRWVWDAGLDVAIATDCNPGTSPVERMPFVVALAVLEMGLTPDEALWAATLGGARSLRLSDRGSLSVGERADLVVLDADDHAVLSYRPDHDHVWRVVSGGVAVPG